MMKIALTISLSVLSAPIFAQNSNLGYKYGLKVYNQTSFEVTTKWTVIDDSAGLSSEYTEKALQILHPTIAFQWKSKKNNFHEVELTSVMFGKLSAKTDVIDNSTNSTQTVLGSDVSRMEIAMRYEFILNFLKSKERKLVPSVGFGVSPYFNRTSTVPKTANLFPTNEMSVGVKGFVTPRLTYYLSPRLFLDVNLPICVLDSYLLTSERSDPAIALEERTISMVNFQQFPKYFTGRIGLGLKL